ncbi:hypothetical protein LWI28_027582 [Acer negundo]|uniref:Uncharacterized protein n=1 Tax=Acer negundo TaxID=4023 RepID=A0AAD5P4F1_ACENE|nr:hypothetical protein LWI28_027582 [Acer negundo]
MATSKDLGGNQDLVHGCQRKETVVDDVMREDCVPESPIMGKKRDVFTDIDSSKDTAVVSHNDKKLRLTGFYGHPNVTQRFHDWTLLRRLSRIWSLPWLVGKDFNEILCVTEKLGGNIRRDGQMNNFRMTLEDCDLRFRFGSWLTLCSQELVLGFRCSGFVGSLLLLFWEGLG